jgi:hypothetical protein
MDNKVRISMTIDPKILKRIDAVCDAREEPRSAYIERVLKHSLREEEAYLEEMESPLWRGIYKALSSPGTLTMLAKVLGDELSDEDKAQMATAVRKHAKRGQERAKQKQSSKASKR